VRNLEFGEILEIVVLVAIAIELFALYSHSRLDHRIDEHLMEDGEKLAKSESLMNMLDQHMSRLDEHMVRTDEWGSKLDEDIRVLVKRNTHRK
jgi:hypothetical protein